MNEYEATIQINPTDDIKFILEESGCYESEIEVNNPRLKSRACGNTSL